MKFKSATMFMIALAFAGVLLHDWMRPIPGLAEEYRLGTVTANVNLRKTPDLQGDVVAGLPKGLPVKVYGEKDGWYRVSATKNYILFNGWVYKRYVEILSAEAAESLPTIKSPQPIATRSPQTKATVSMKPSAPPSTAAKTTRPSSTEPAKKPASAAGAKKTAAQGRPAAEKQSAATLAGNSTVPTPVAPATGNARLLLSVSPLVLAIIALLVAVKAFKRTPTPAAGRESEKPQPLAPPPDTRPTITPGEPPVNEKRQAPRLNRLVEVDFAVDGKFYRGFINNLSETGVYVDTPETFNVGQQITISCPDIESGGHIKRDGMIVRLTKTGIAVHFQQSVLP